MGTRGLYGFRKNGMDKLTYNHYDSYPSYLGEIMVEFCKTTSIKEMNDIFDRIVLVEEDDVPTETQITECIEYYNGDVSRRTPEDWYCLLRETQGNPNVYKHGLKYMIDHHEFIKDSLFCEYAYIINLDHECLEFWVGFQMKPDEDNRYGMIMEIEDGYYPCKMIAEYPLDTINQFSTQVLVDSMNSKADEDGDEDMDEPEDYRGVAEDDLEYISDEIKNGCLYGSLENGIEWRLEFII